MRIIVAIVSTTFLASLAWGGEAHDVRGWNPQTDANDVIDAKCKACHSRQRIETAVANKVDVQDVLQRMEAKGLKLNPTEKEVLGIFWRTPFKKK